MKPYSTPQIRLIDLCPDASLMMYSGRERPTKPHHEVGGDQLAPHRLQPTDQKQWPWPE
ncbi:MAG: hypothetical protein KBS47_03910 [Bacteroidales bacterium]|nr:hypothetical protein [Candidatus Equimonas enterica]